jgi:hypothetical protein
MVNFEGGGDASKTIPLGEYKPRLRVIMFYIYFFPVMEEG